MGFCMTSHSYDVFGETNKHLQKLIFVVKPEITRNTFFGTKKYFLEFYQIKITDIKARLENVNKYQKEKLAIAFNRSTVVPTSSQV